MGGSTVLALSFLKANLGFFAAPVDVSMNEYLDSLLLSSRTELKRDMKIELDLDDMNDAEFLAMYAAWKYRKRDTGEGKGEMLRKAIRNRQVSDITGGEDT